MTYIIIGLGNFGVALAEKLTSMGHDVFGVDSDIRLVEEYKDEITSTICVNLTDTQSIKSLPIDDADSVIVALGDNIGNSILVTALLKKVGVKNLVVRAINSTHETILNALGVKEIITPEKSTANIWAITAESKKIKSVYYVSEKYQILECKIPSILEGQTLVQANIEENFGVRIIAIKRRYEKSNFLGGSSPVYEVEIPDRNFTFAHQDRIVIYGSNMVLAKYKKQML